MFQSLQALPKKTAHIIVAELKEQPMENVDKPHSLQALGESDVSHLLSDIIDRVEAV